MRKKHRKRKLDKTVFRTLIFVIGLIMYWVWFFHISRDATENNTYKTYESIVDVEVNVTRSNRQHSTLLIVTDGDNEYLLDFKKRSDKRASELAENLRGIEEEVEITVWNHYPKAFLTEGSYAIMHSGRVAEVVDIRTDEKIYWNIDDHNSFQKRQRIYGPIGGILITVFVLFLVFLTYIASYWRTSSKTPKKRRNN